MSKRQKVKEREKRRKERLSMGKDKLCHALAEGRACPLGERCLLHPLTHRLTITRLMFF